MAGAIMAGAVVRHDDRARRGDDDRCGSRNDDGCRHNRGRRHDDGGRLRHDNGLRDNRSGLRDDDGSRLGDNGRLRIDNDGSRLCDDSGLRIDDDRSGLRYNGWLRVDDDGGWRLDGFRDIGDGVYDVKHRVEAAVVVGSAVMVMGLGLEAVASQHESGDGQTEDGVACVFHGVLLFHGLVCWLTCLCFPSSPNQYHMDLFFSNFSSFFFKTCSVALRLHHTNMAEHLVFLKNVGFFCLLAIIASSVLPYNIKGIVVYSIQSFRMKQHAVSSGTKGMPSLSVAKTFI